MRGGLVLEVGCGAGALTRYLLAAGHRVVATDASAPDKFVRDVITFVPAGMRTVTGVRS